MINHGCKKSLNPEKHKTHEIIKTKRPGEQEISQRGIESFNALFKTKNR